MTTDAGHFLYLLIFYLYIFLDEKSAQIFYQLGLWSGFEIWEFFIYLYITRFEGMRLANFFFTSIMFPTAAVFDDEAQLILCSVLLLSY